MDEPVTPGDLERELGFSAKHIRVYLRSRYGLLSTHQLTRWELTSAQAAEVRTHFSEGQ